MIIILSSLASTYRIGRVDEVELSNIRFFQIMKSNAPKVAMSTAVLEMLAANPAHEDRFNATLPGKGTLEKSYQWHRSLPWLELEDAGTM